MVRSERPFAQVDVFAGAAYRGNPVAVVLDAEGLETEQMQDVARWTNLSETTFVLKPTAPDADYRLRIFTPNGELPFAGHPTLGSAHAWLEHGHTPQHASHVVQECSAGLIVVRRDGSSLRFAAPPVVRDGDLEEPLLQDFMTALGVRREQVVSHQWVDNGPGWAVLRLRSAEDVLALEPNLSSIPTAMVGVVGAYPAGSPFAYELRAFAPRIGVVEDPVCGSMNASVAQWLIRTGVVNAPYRVSQGGRVGSAGEIDISSDPDGTVWVGGATTSLVRGQIIV